MACGWRGLLAACACLGAAMPGDVPTPVYTFSVLPELRAEVVYADWAPLLQAVSRETGTVITLRLYESAPEFEQELLAGEPDFAYMTGYQAVLAHRRQGYVPLVRDSAHLLHGILVVRNDSSVTVPKQVEGGVIAFPAPNTFASSMYLRALLTEQEHIHFNPEYVVSHPNVYRHVILRKAVAGGGVSRTLEAEPEELRSQLRVIYETPGLTPHPIGAHPRVPADIRRAVTEAFLRLAHDPALVEQYRRLDLAAPIRADYAQDYAPLERMGLEKYWRAD